MSRQISEWQLRMADPMAVRRLAAWLKIEDAPWDLDRLIPRIVARCADWKPGWSMY